MAFNILIQLLASAMFFLGGLGAGLAIARVKAGRTRAVALVFAGMLVGGFLGYTYVLSQVFSIENRIQSSTGDGIHATSKPASPR